MAFIPKDSFKPKDSFVVKDSFQPSETGKSAGFADKLKQAVTEAITGHPLGQDIRAMLGQKEEGMGAGQRVRGAAAMPILEGLRAVKDATVSGIKGDGALKGLIGEAGDRSFGELLPPEIQQINTGVPDPTNVTNPFMEIASRMIGPDKGKTMNVADAIKDAEELATIYAATKLGGPVKRVFKEIKKGTDTAVQRARYQIAKKMGKKFPVTKVSEGMAKAVADGKISVADAAKKNAQVFQQELQKRGAPTADIAKKARNIVGNKTSSGKELVVANIGADNKIYYGKPGELHFNLSNQHSAAIRKKMNLKPGDATWKDTGFAVPGGKFLTREEALKLTKVKSSIGNELDALDLREQAGKVDISSQDVTKSAEEVVNLLKVEEGIGAITRSSGALADSPAIAALKAGNPNLLGKTAEGVRDMMLQIGRPEMLVNWLDNFQPDGPNTKYIFNELVAADNYKLNEATRTKNVIMESLKGINLPKIYNKTLTVSGLKNAKGKLVKINRNEALDIYANSLNAHNRQVLNNTGVSDAMIKHVEKVLSPEEKQAVHKLMEYFAKDQYPMVADIHKKATGTDLEQEEYYWSLNNLEDVPVVSDLDDKMLFGAGKFTQSTPTQGFVKERIADPSLRIKKFDFFGKVYKHHANVEHYKAYRLPLQRVNKYVNTPAWKDNVIAKFGPDYYKVTKKWLDDIAYGGGKSVNNIWDKSARALRSNFATSVLGFNLISASRQPASFLQGAKMTGYIEAIKSVTKFGVDPWEMVKTAEDKSTMMRYRGFTQEREMQEILSGRSPISRIFDKVGPYQGMKELSMSLILTVDKMTTSIIWDAGYNKALKSGMNEEMAVEAADRVVRRTQPMGKDLYLPHLYREGEWLKSLTMFTNQLNQNFNLVTEEMLKEYSDKDGVLKKPMNLMAVLVPLLIGGYYMGVLNNKKQPTGGELAAETVNQFTGGIPLIGPMINYAGRVATGKYAYPASAAPPQIAGVLGATERIISSKKLSTKARHARLLTGYLTGIPMIQAERFWKGQPFGAAPKKKGSKKSKAKGFF